MRHYTHITGAGPDQAIGLILFDRVRQPANGSAQGKYSQSITFRQIQQPGKHG